MDESRGEETGFLMLFPSKGVELNYWPLKDRDTAAWPE